MPRSYSPAPFGAPLPPHVRWAMLGLSLAILLAQLGATVVNVGLPTLMQTFHQGFAAVQWVVLSYLLAVTALIVSVGRLGDLWGKKRLFRWGLALFTLAGALCALAPSVPLLIAARAVQGLGAAVMLSLTMAFVGDVVPKSRSGYAMGLLSTVQSVATTLAPSVGGLAIAYLGWRSMFWISVPIGVLAYVIVDRYLPDVPPPSVKPRFDWPGTVVLVLVLSAYSLAMTEGQSRGFGDALTFGLLLAAAAGLALFVALQARVPSPLVHLGLFRSLPFNASMATTLLVTTVMMSTLTLGPFYLSQALHLPTEQVGVVMSIGPLIAALMGLPSGKLVDRFGARPTMVGGLVCLSLGTVCMAFVAGLQSLVGYVIAISLISIGYAFFQTPNNTAVMAEAAGDRRATVSSLINLSRNLGLVSGASLIGSIFAAASGLSARHAGASADAAVVAHGMTVSFVVASAMVGASLLLGVLALRQTPPAEETAPVAAQRARG